MAHKKTENIIIGFDVQTSVVNVLRNIGDDFCNVNIEQFDIDRKLVLNKKVGELLDVALKNYVLEHQPKQADVFIVLPDNFVTLNQITLPIMAKSKLKSFVKSELAKIYSNFSNYQANITTISKNKKQVTYSVVMVDKSVLHECSLICKKYNLNLRDITYSSNCLVNSVFALAPKTRHENFLLLNIEEKQSKLIYVSNNRTICFGVLPFGKNFLNDENSSIRDFVTQTESLKQVFYATENLTYSGTFSNDPLEKENAFKTFCEKYNEEQNEKQKFVTEFETNYSKFSIFANFAVVFQNTIANSYKLPKPEKLLVNTTSKIFMDYIKGCDFDIDVELLKNEIPSNCLLCEFLDLFGAIYSDNYNFEHNFLNKESKNNAFQIKFNIDAKGRR